MQVTLTEQEIKNIMAALDHLAKQGGLNTAKALLPTAEKLQQHLNASTDPEQSNEEK